MDNMYKKCENCGKDVSEQSMVMHQLRCDRKHEENDEENEEIDMSDIKIQLPTTPPPIPSPSLSPSLSTVEYVRCEKCEQKVPSKSLLMHKLRCDKSDFCELCFQVNLPGHEDKHYCVKCETGGLILDKHRCPKDYVCKNCKEEGSFPESHVCPKEPCIVCTLIGHKKEKCHDYNNAIFLLTKKGSSRPRATEIVEKWLSNGTFVTNYNKDLDQDSKNKKEPILERLQ